MEIAGLDPILPGPITGQTLSQRTASEQSTAAADFDSFLTLLTAQLRNQDPLSPLDSTEFIAQLASFSSVEQQIGTNDRLDILTQQSFGGDVAAFANWIGNGVVMSDGSFRSIGNPVEFDVPEFGTAERVEVVVKDVSGGELAGFTVAELDNGKAVWDGKDNSGRPLLGRDLVIEVRSITEGVVANVRPAEILREVSGLRGGTDGVSLELKDGGIVSPDGVVRLAQI